MQTNIACYNLRTMCLVLLILLVLMPRLQAQNTQAFSIGNIEAKPGEKVSGKLHIEKGIDQETFIPVTIIHGTKPGPVLTLNAGMHGTEYVPVIALQKLGTMVNPNDLSGTLVLIHIANVLAFQQRMVYNNPVDGKNLNRMFPGKKNGSISERIAYTLTHQVLKKSDYYIDLHGGEFNESITDYLFFGYNCPTPEQDEKSRLMAHATGNKYLIPFDYKLVPDSAPSEYSEVEATRQGVAAVTLEWGGRGMVEEEVVQTAVKGMINVMRTLDMLPGETFVNENPVYFICETAVKCNYSGILYSFVEQGQYLSKGTLIAYTTNYHGELLEKYYAPCSGIVEVAQITPSINKGEDVCRICEISDTFEP